MKLRYLIRRSKKNHLWFIFCSLFLFVLFLCNSALCMHGPVASSFLVALTFGVFLPYVGIAVLLVTIFELCFWLFIICRVLLVVREKWSPFQTDYHLISESSIITMICCFSNTLGRSTAGDGDAASTVDDVQRAVVEPPLTPLHCEEPQVVKVPAPDRNCEVEDTVSYGDALKAITIALEESFSSLANFSKVVWFQIFLCAMVLYALYVADVTMDREPRNTGIALSLIVIIFPIIVAMFIVIPESTEARKTSRCTTSAPAELNEELAIVEDSVSWNDRRSSIVMNPVISNSRISHVIEK